MKRYETLYRLNLKLFDGDGDGGTSDAGAVTGAGMGEAGSTGDTGKPSAAGKARTRARNPLATVQYGKPAEPVKDDGGRDAAGEEPPAEQAQPVDRRAQFERLIREEYKDEFSQRVQGIIDKRFKETKTLESKLEQLQPVVEMLSAKYGVQSEDVGQLAKALEDDDAYYEQEALEKGVSVETLKAMKRMERENAELRKAVEQKEREEGARETYANWMRQGEELKAVYPSFDFATEVQNPQFLSLLRSNVPVKTAYEVIHKDDIIGGAMQYTAEQVRRAAAAAVQTQGRRPVENGGSAQGAIQRKEDVTALTRADRREIERRALRGERIVF